MKSVDAGNEPLFLDYERVSHHRSMMSDRVRIEQYRRAIEETVKPGDIVVDLGTGTGILSLIASKCLPRTIYAIERTDIIEVAERIAHDNGVTNITFIKGDSCEIELPTKCDVLLSECLGYLVVQENMITDFYRFRDKWLKPEGSLIPLDGKLFFGPIASASAYSSVSFWNSIQDVHGFNYKALSAISANSASHECLSMEDFLSQPILSHEFNFLSDIDPSLKCDVVFEIAKDGTLVGIGGYFESTLSDNVILDTSPLSQTHWRQHIFPVNKPRVVRIGDRVRFSLVSVMRRALVDWKWDVQINDEEPESHSTELGIRLKETVPTR